MTRISARFAAALAALAALVLAGAAAEASRPVEQRRFVLDPNMGYILARVGPVQGESGRAPIVYFVRLDPEKRSPLWDLGQGNINSRRQLNGAEISGRSHWGTDGRTSLFVVPVTPGFWVVGGAGGTAFSLGSYGFEVRPGELTYVGTILTGRQNGESPIPEIAASRLSTDLVEFGTLMNIVMSDAMMVTPAAEGEALPPALAAFTVRRAELVADVRFGNFLRSLVNRALGLPPLGHQPIPPPGQDPLAPPEDTSPDPAGAPADAAPPPPADEAPEDAPAAPDPAG